MEKATKQEIYSKLCFSSATFLPMILVLVVFLFSPISTTSYSFLLTIPIALLSTMFLVTMTRKKGSVDENQVQEKEQKEDIKPSSADFTQTDEPTQQSSESDQIQEHQTEAQSDSSPPSDGGNFELDHHNGIQEMGISDNLASDSDDDDEEEEEEEEEDSLIEISLPSSDFHGLTEESEIKLESKLPDFLPEYIFRQQGFRELLEEINEINEDDNLIEIDISMGSSKFQDLRLLGDQCTLSD